MMKTFLWCVAASCLICGCTIRMPTEFVVLICVVNGDTLYIGSDSAQVINCANLDSLVAGS